MSVPILGNPNTHGEVTDEDFEQLERLSEERNEISLVTDTRESR